MNGKKKSHYPTIDMYMQTKKLEKRTKAQKKSDESKRKFIRTMIEYTHPRNKEVVVPVNWKLVDRMNAQTRIMAFEKAIPN